MEKDDIKLLFENLKNDFDTESPSTGHEERFLEKLNRSKGVVQISNKKTTWWKPLSIAASIVVICVLGFQLVNKEDNIKEQIVKISPEVSQTEFYFASLIEEQVQELRALKSPETEQLVDDTLKQINRLETDYNNLEQELVAGGDSKLILNAMINNFQTRIDLLKEVLTTIESIKNLNYQDDANFTI
ncbi:hypothetical protein [Croceitalea rosinachiae]|uniref:Uncharacterized protein n=1 Tax=Croceitalea rosinachiae TaxID=3075596 RepID=A0ABU3AF22_9FLAO|nr:hypothetical protein [Croceitalea sp. F388]MDT0608523.1 hypothetical protein [Croceitalea sp. F388]